MTNLVNTDELSRVTGYERPGDIEKCLRKNGIPVLYGRNGQIFTTLDAVNAALGINTKPTEKYSIKEKEIEFL